MRVDSRIPKSNNSLHHLLSYYAAEEVMMAEAFTTADEETEQSRLSFKRRKVRKGTQSCWECKRRKIRCTSVNQAEAVCDGCRSRKVPCISQLFHDEQVATLARQSTRRGTSMIRQRGQNGDNPATETNPKTKTKSTTTRRRQQHASPPDTSGSHAQTTRSSLGDRSNGRHQELCEALLAVWPSQHDLDTLTSIPVGTSMLFHGTVCMPYSKLLDKDLPSLRHMLQMPSPGSHPVLLAHKLLLLGSFLQGIPRGAARNLVHLQDSYPEIMSSVFEAATKLVTRDDNLVQSLEGMECIMLESMYQNNAGSLRHAWLANRRAISLAQIMGLDQPGASLPDVLDVKTRERIEPAYMWFRLITSDRYLSLMLGLPQAMGENKLSSHHAMDGCLGVERMERMECHVGGLMLQRQREDLHDLETTHEMDRLLLDAAASLPPEWWLTPSIVTMTSSDTNAFSDTIRIMNQFVHYHLLTRLHLPYLLRSSADAKYDYSKITATSASRELLSRFVHLRSSNMVAAYCRGIDFLAFTASTALSLAHIDTRRQSRLGLISHNHVLHTLSHQRLADRGLMERTLQIINQMSVEDHDAIASEIASILKRLLTIESAAAAASSDPHSTTVPSENTRSSQPFENKHSDILDVTIPHLGTIRIQRDGLVTYVDPTRSNLGGRAGSNAWPKPTASTASHLDLDQHQQEEDATPTSPMNPMGPSDPIGDEWTFDPEADLLQGIDTALFDTLFLDASWDLQSQSSNPND